MSISISNDLDVFIKTDKLRNSKSLVIGKRKSFGRVEEWVNFDITVGKYSMKPLIETVNSFSTEDFRIMSGKGSDDLELYIIDNGKNSKFLHLNPIRISKSGLLNSIGNW
ncbi:hypothetical protein [Pseudalkalibacillus caeni]|uniref:Uncharacterized protein n=1 Tax=Exobacillus caeni TaxID=2574798 RepID=A0A5R9FDE6_9BACL|nr:hypothetical protein [Pseudalkalibacillus caeni]TLS38584.1 hypothetical protein FCL54_03535 [Pseudalkalibacillus caeni]